MLDIKREGAHPCRQQLNFLTVRLNGSDGMRISIFLNEREREFQIPAVRNHWLTDAHIKMDIFLNNMEIILMGIKVSFLTIKERLWRIIYLFNIFGDLHGPDGNEEMQRWKRCDPCLRSVHKGVTETNIQTNLFFFKIF